MFIPKSMRTPEENMALETLRTVVGKLSKEFEGVGILCQSERPEFKSADRLSVWLRFYGTTDTAKKFQINSGILAVDRRSMPDSGHVCWERELLLLAGPFDKKRRKCTFEETTIPIDQNDDAIRNIASLIKEQGRQLGVHLTLNL